jgi:hypothetical protein
MSKTTKPLQKRMFVGTFTLLLFYYMVLLMCIEKKYEKNIIIYFFVAHAIFRGGQNRKT